MRMMAVGARRTRRRRGFLSRGFMLGLGMCLALISREPGAAAQRSAKSQREPIRAIRPEPLAVERLPLDPNEKQLLDRTVDHALEYLANHQNADGSFQVANMARPAVTGLCIMAFLSRGHRPGEGQYGSALEKAIDFILGFQDQETGAITPESSSESFFWTRAAAYTHGICGTALADVFPFTGRLKYRAQNRESQDVRRDTERHDRVERAVRKALSFTHTQQTRPKVVAGETGGWRYIESNQRNDSDLSVTAWNIMFLHSAKKSGFKVPDSWVKSGLRFVHRTFNKKLGGFVYVLTEPARRHCTRATVGGGILCLLLGGEPVSQQVMDAASWIHQHPFEQYNLSSPPGDRYHYSAFYCSQAMGLLGGSDFREFYPRLLHVLAENQHTDGSWDPESFASDTGYGEVYSTALAVLALSPPYQKLDTYKR
ncbi:MAG TPA: hypothetical protein VFG04_04840 [Planctomycetaceae bacterium]|jgi:hypothetical protein|nr:hypothetical protein [Planctomycetaceae bacterium]